MGIARPPKALPDGRFRESTTAKQTDEGIRAIIRTIIQLLESVFLDTTKTPGQLREPLARQRLSYNKLSRLPCGRRPARA